ncbi:MAG: 4-hydroxy-tetrahydrodipicolinate synthase [Candidatus Cloacimonetes bacterium]|nr:4-hydroxy-tetrahydrodipicolinate synthase [Candidatus Cloacimonadota bacterium]
MLKGSIPALVTPFKNNEIDYNSLEKLLNFHLENQTDGLVLLGTTGEGATLANDEKEALLRFAVQRLKSKLPIIAGTGSNNLPHTISATQKAESLGVDYAMIVTPYYNKPNQEGLYLYFKELANKTNLPIIIYNVPGRTGVNISAETVIKLANDFPEKIVAIKEASGDIIKASRIVRDTPDSFALLSGEDALNFPLMCVGSKGAISVTANVVPKEMHLMLNYALEGDCARSLSIHQHLIELNEVLFIDTNPIPVKYILAHLDLLEIGFRLPLCPTSDDKKAKIIAIFNEFKNKIQ